MSKKRKRGKTMINLTHPSCTSPKTLEKLKKFSCVAEMAESVFEEYKR